MTEGSSDNARQDGVALTSGGVTSRVLRAGDVIGGKYRLTGLIGKGGMGYVFRAEYEAIGKEYALKMLAPDQVNEVTWNRFQDEGRAIAKLDHPNIVKIYDMGVDRGDSPYYVMELLDGISLADYIQHREAYNVDEILHMFMQIAEGFGYAHRRGIIHRDVKPGNIVLVDLSAKYPTCKIVDFGIAKLTGKSDLNKQSMTATGDVFGSPYYMSPEQCLGEEIDQRSDIYSLGCALFEVLAGKPPFVGESAIQTVLMHQNKPSPTLESVSGKFSSDEMEALVAKMLMKRPADRYQSMEQVYHDLDRIIQRKGVGRNVDTGFTTSVDSQLTDLGEKIEAERQKFSVLKWVVIGLAGLIAVSGICLCAHNILWATKAPTTGEKSKFGLKKNYFNDIDTHEMREDLAKQSAKSDQRVKPITSTITQVGRVFHCPDFPVGSLFWRRGAKDLNGVDDNNLDDGWVVAIGEAKVPADQPILLTVDSIKSHKIWEDPQILSRFGPDELCGIKVDTYIDPTLEDEEAKQVSLSFIKALSPWRKLQSFECAGLLMPREVLAELGKHKELREFRFRNSQIDGLDLGQAGFLRNLSVLFVADLKEVDPVLKGLKGSSAITDILIENAKFTASGLKNLADCHNLTVLKFDRCYLDASGLEAIASIKSLRQLVIGRCSLTADQIPVLAKFKFIKEPILGVLPWHKEDVVRLRQVLPNLRLPVPEPPRPKQED